MNPERELESSPVPSSMSSSLAGVLVVGCIVAGIAISGRQAPSPHADELATVESTEAPIELLEQSDFIRRPTRFRSPASTLRSREMASAESEAPAIDPLAEASATKLPTLASEYSPKGSQPNQTEPKATARTQRIAELSSEVRLVSGTSPARPRLRVRTPEATQKVETATEPDSPPLRPSRPIANDSPREDRSPRLTHHTIRDGDTLESIAEVRWGNARRWRELYDLNRDLLSDPASLPVGARLRLSREPRKIASVHQDEMNDLEPIGAPRN